MSSTSTDMQAAERARREAEMHRQEIAHTIEALGEKIGRSVESAQQTKERVKEKIDDLETKARQPLEWIRANPWPAVGIALAVGFFFAGSPRKRRRKVFDDRTLNGLQRAYEAGRKDERSSLHHGDVGDDLKELLMDVAKSAGGLSALLAPLLGSAKKKLASGK